MPARRTCLKVALCSALPGVGPAAARAGTAPVVLGHVYPATGIFAQPAAQMKAAIDAAVLAANARGGIAGQPLKVVSLDDEYQPAKSLAAAQALVRDQGAIALVCPLGAPTVGQLMPWAEANGVPLIGARSGADSQRAYRRFTFFNVATFGDEVRYIARHLDTIDLRRVGLAAMNNPTGAEIADQFQAVAGQHRLDVATPQRFEASGTDAPAVARALVAARPQAVLVAGGGLGAIELIRQLLQAGMPPTGLYCISIIGPEQLMAALGTACNGVVITQVMPRLGDVNHPITADYPSALARLAQPAPSLVGLEAFISMQVAITGLRLSSAASGAALALALERAGPLNLGGFRVRYDTQSHHGTRYVDIGLAMNGRLVR